MSFRLIASIALLASSTLFAQDVLDKVSADACTCMGKLNKDEAKTDEFQTKLGLCFIQAAMPYEKELKKKHGLDMSHMDEETGRQLGVLIATRMATQCPDLLTVLASMNDDEEAAVAEAPVSSLDGEVVNTKKDAFLTLSVRTGSGRTVDLLWLEFFDGADALNNGNAQGVKGAFTYTERELFDAAAGSYRKYNVITGFAAQ